MLKIDNTKIYKYIILIIISLGIVIFTYNNYFLYKSSILKITNIDTNTKINKENNEKYYTQTITGVVKNGKYKGKEYTLENYTSYSGVYDEQIHKHSELIVEISSDGEKVMGITSIKRDKYIVILLLIFLDSIIIVGNKKGLKTILSLFINILISAFTIFIYEKHFGKVNILLLFIPVSIFFIIFSLYATNGKDRKTFAAIASAIISLLLSFLLSFIMIKIYTSTIPYWFMDYIEAVRDYENLFFVNVLLGGLGAIMDISITMSSSLNELISKNDKITKEALIKSGKEISKDIVGTMISVMLFTIYTGIIPMALLAVRNNMPLSGILTTYGEVEMIRVLTSSISIVLAIPISLYISIYILKKGEDKND